MALCQPMPFDSLFFCRPDCLANTFRFCRALITVPVAFSPFPAMLDICFNDSEFAAAEWLQKIEDIHEISLE